MRWTTQEVDETRVATLRRATGLSRPACSHLASVGVEESGAAAFLDPRLAHLSDPFLLRNMETAVRRLLQAMAEGEEVLIFGDYDVDGVTSTVLLASVLRRFGLSVRFFVPRRLKEGYGLSLEALERALQPRPPGLLIAVDCGTNSIAEVAHLRAKGTDVLIVDHHLPKDGIPSDCIIINPHVFDPPGSPWAHLSAVGVTFKLAHALLKHLRAEGDPTACQINPKDFLDLVALGTLADLVPLLGENRIFARIGLRRLQMTKRAGLAALFRVSKIATGAALTPSDVSFRLGPRINASGRLADATLPIELLLGDDFSRCDSAARRLDAYNRERQGLERDITKQAEDQAANHSSTEPGLVLYGPDWHPGVVGIVASRISRKFHRPAIILGAEGELAKGSGRSIPGINLVDALHPCGDLMVHWGGHAMAVGVTLESARIDRFREAFVEALETATRGEPPEPEINLTSWLEANDLAQSLLDELALLEPFGQGNPEPLFGLRGVTLEAAPEEFGGGHLRFYLPARHRPLQGILWNGAEDAPPVGQPVDFAVRLAWNNWNGHRTARATVEAWRMSAA